MNCLTLPTEFTLEGISACFVQVFKVLAPLVVQGSVNENFTNLGNSQGYREDINKDLVGDQINSRFAYSKPVMAVDFCTVDGLLNSITQKIMKSLQGLEDSVNKLIENNDRLILTVGKGLRTVKTRSDILEKKIESLKIYTKEHLMKAFLNKKKKSIFKNWKKEVKKQKTVSNMLKKSLVKIHNTKLKSGLERWKKLVSIIQEFKAQSTLLKNEKETLKKLTVTIQGEFESIKSNIYSLAVEKADVAEVNDLKALATKTDLRVLYNDMRGILVSYFNNFKSTNQEKFEEVNLSIENIKENLTTKADVVNFADLSNFAGKLKEEIIETNRNHKNLNEQFSNYTKSAQIQKTHFQIELLEKKFSSLELKFSEDKAKELDFGEIIKIAESKKIIEIDRPARLTDILEKQSNYARKRNSFSNSFRRK